MRLTSIGSNIKSLRESRGMTQRALAAELAVTQPLIVAIEHDRKRPSLELAIQIAELFGCSVEELKKGKTA